MTLKQRLWLKEYLASGNASQAALKVYDCTEESARRIGSENLTKLDINDEVQFWMEKEGLTDQKLVNKINMLIDHKDWRAVSDGLNKAMKLKGLEKPQEIKGEITFIEKTAKKKAEYGID